MNTEAEPPKKQGFFRRIFSAPARLSIAARAAWLMAFGLIVLVITAWLIFYLDKQTLPWTHAMGWWRILVEILLVIIIPIVVYRALRVWLEGEKARYPDIDFAWNAGVEALRASGIPLDSAPIFLVLGAANESQEKSLMQSAGMGFRVANVPEGPAALHWYANPEAIFICCSEVGWLTALAALRAKIQRQTGGRDTAMMSAGGQLSTATQASAPAPSPGPSPSRAPAPAPPAPADDQRGTISVDSFMEQQAAAAGPAPEVETSEPATARPDSAEFGSMRMQSGDVDMPVMVGERDSVEQLERMEYFCRYLVRTRAPLCGINGVLTLLQFESLQGATAEVEHLQRAINGDLSAIQQTVQLRTPTIATIIGLENERGFREMVRRVGRERAAIQRFGQKFDVRRYSTAGDLNALSAHVCGAFEDWVYALFREKEALTKPGNRYLYGLLCKVRCNLRSRLGSILADGYGYEPQRVRDDDRFFFSGCYFAATGTSADRQAFVRGVIEKLVGEQELLEWNDQAIASQRRYRTLTIIGYVAAGVLLLGSIAAIWYRWYAS